MTGAFGRQDEGTDLSSVSGKPHVLDESSLASAYGREVLSRDSFSREEDFLGETWNTFCGYGQNL